MDRLTFNGLSLEPDEYPVESIEFDPPRKPQVCRVYGLGFVTACRWSPRLGNGYYEHKQHLWAQRWTFHFGREWVGFHRPTS